MLLQSKGNKYYNMNQATKRKIKRKTKTNPKPACMQLSLACFAYFSNLHNRWISIYTSQMDQSPGPLKSRTFPFIFDYPGSKPLASLQNGIVFGCKIPTKYHGLSTHSVSAAILPEPRPPIFPKDPTADKPLKLLLPSLLKFRDLLIFLCLEEVMSLAS